MNEEINALEELEEESLETVDESNGMTMDDLQKVFEEKFEQIRRHALLTGSQSMCHVILNKITTAMAQPGKRSMNDYKRLVKDIRSFCETGISRNVNLDGTTSEKEEPMDETVQN